MNAQAKLKLPGVSSDTTPFPAGAMHFLAQLGQNNTKEWFQAHKPDYEGQLVSPLKRFMAELSEPMKRLDARLDTGYRVNTTVMRINRDQRFSRGAGPYRNYVKVSFPLLGEKWSSDPVLGFGIFPDQFYVAFRNCGEQRKAYVERYEKNLRKCSPLVARWVEKRAVDSKLRLLGGSHEDIMEIGPCPDDPQKWKRLGEATIGRTWDRNQVVSLQGNFVETISYYLSSLYFLKLLAITEHPERDAERYFDALSLDSAGARS